MEIAEGQGKPKIAIQPSLHGYVKPLVWKWRKEMKQRNMVYFLLAHAVPFRVSIANSFEMLPK